MKSYWHDYKLNKTTPADYFKGALNLHQKYDMDRALRNGGIVPSTAKAYRVSDFDRALKNAFGVSKVGYWCRYALINISPSVYPLQSYKFM